MANGHPVLAEQVVVNAEVVRALEQALADAKAGRTSAIAIVSVYGPGEMNVTAGGAAAMEINCAADMLKRMALDQLVGKRSSILRPIR